MGGIPVHTFFAHSRFSVENASLIKDVENISCATIFQSFRTALLYRFGRLM